MKLIEIRLKNIHSLAGEHVIDFSRPPLSGTGIFAITGPTGAGKSTILDAITLALFARISRYDSSVKAAIENEGGVVTRGRSEAFAQVTYEVDGERFVSRWEMRRSQRNMFVYDSQGNALAAGLRDVPVFNEEKIGLNYEQFIRAVILPQGQFAAFLRADSDRRIEILEKITGTEIYRIISKRAFEKAKEKRLEWENLKQRLEDIELLGQNQIAELNEDKLALGELVSFTEKNKNHLRQQLDLKLRIKDLSGKLQAVRQNLKKSEQEYQDFQPQIKKLERHKTVLPFTAQLTRLDNLTAQVSKLDEQAKKLDEQITGIDRQLKSGNINAENLQKELTELNEKLEKALPLLRQIKQLENKLETLQSLLSESKEQQQKTSAQVKQNNAQLNRAKTQIQALNKDLDGLQKWLENNKTLEHLTTILEKLKNNLLQYDKKRKALRQTISENSPSLLKNLTFHKLDNDIKLLENELDTITQKITALRSAAGQETDINEIQNQLNLVTEKQQALAQALTIATDIQTLENQTLKIRDEIQNLNRQIEQEKQKEQQLQKLVEARLKQAEIAEKQLELEQIKQSSAFIRQKLQDGDTCPVCGHTFRSSSAPQVSVSSLDNYKLQLQKARDQLEQARNELNLQQKQLEKLGTTLDERTQQLQNLNEQITGKTRQIQQLLRQHSIALENITSDAIQALRKKLDTQTKQLQEKIKILNQTRELENRQNSVRQYIETFGELYELKQTIAEEIEPFKQYLANAKTTAEIIDTLERLTSLYNQKLDEKQQIINNITALTATVKELERQKTVLSESLQTTGKKIRELEKQITVLNSEKNQLWQRLGQKKPLSPDEYEHSLRTEIQHKQNQLTRLKENIARLLAQRKTLNSQRILALEEKNKLSQQIQQLEQQLSGQLKPLGFDTIEQAKNALLDPQTARQTEQTAEKLRQQIQALNKEATLLAGELQQLEKNTSTDLTIEQLTQLIEHYTGLLNTLNRKIGSIDQALLTNKQNLKLYEQRKAQVLEAQADFERWERLNRLIGSANGDKFQRIVQEYNFTHLIAEANRHLQKLAPRYSLTYRKGRSGVKDTFDLFIIDNEMAGEQRSIKSLSGGETFLVSLAMALALSSMASYRVSLHNLFIDEGFGSLDNQTLDLALSTLEKLQSGTNRQIGIISHVEPLKERIPVKIQVTKLSGGLSSISVLES